MTESRSHLTTANRLAKKFNTEYNRGQGADIQTADFAIEVETPESIGDAGRQLQGYQIDVFVAGTNQDAVDRALERYKNSSIGVMNNQGEIIKRSSRG